MARLLLKGDAMAVQFEKGRRDVREAREDEMHAKMGEQEVIQLPCAR